MIKGNLSYEAPGSLDRAVQVLMTGDSVTPLAGGTDLVPLMKQGTKKPSCLLDLKNIPSLKSITLTERDLLIGSMATLAEIADHPLVNRICPALAQSCRSVAFPPDPQRGHDRRQSPAGTKMPLFQSIRILEKGCSRMPQIRGRGVPSDFPVRDLPRHLLFGHSPGSPGL